jgi:hypothetical protein
LIRAAHPPPALLPAGGGFSKSGQRLTRLLKTRPKQQEPDMSDPKIQIICTSPGMRRNGVAHPASALYAPDHWSKAALAAFQADPNFLVREVSGAESVTTETDIELRIETEVEKRLKDKADALQTSFETAVTEKAKERVEALETTVSELTAKLEAANTALDAVTAKKTNAKT